MPRTSRKKVRRFPGLKFTRTDRRRVEQMLSKGTWPTRVLKRARILQLLDRRWRVSDIARATGSYPLTIRTVGYRYIEGGLGAAINEQPRPGAKKRLDKRQQTQVVAMLCGSPPS